MCVHTVQSICRHIDTPRHWCPRSEPYTGADSLLYAIHRGWQVHKTVFRQEFWRGRVRPTTVYYFEISHDGEINTMPVVTNPYLELLLQENAADFRIITSFESVAMA